MISLPESRDFIHQWNPIYELIYIPAPGLFLPVFAPFCVIPPAVLRVVVRGRACARPVVSRDLRWKWDWSEWVDRSHPETLSWCWKCNFITVTRPRSSGWMLRGTSQMFSFRSVTMLRVGHDAMTLPGGSAPLIILFSLFFFSTPPHPGESLSSVCEWSVSAHSDSLLRHHSLSPNYANLPKVRWFRVVASSACYSLIHHWV